MVTSMFNEFHANNALAASSNNSQKDALMSERKPLKFDVEQKPAKQGDVNNPATWSVL